MRLRKNNMAQLFRLMGAVVELGATVVGKV